MTNNKFNILVNKYAILIFIGYAIAFIISNIVFRLIPNGNESGIMLKSYLSTFSIIVQFIINMIAAILISKDLKRLNIKNNLIVIMTLLFSLIGITMFFIITTKEIRNAST